MSSKLTTKTSGLIVEHRWKNSSNLLHRVDGPAYEMWNNGVLEHQSWYLSGVLHREDGPAITHVSTQAKDGRDGIDRMWFVNGHMISQRKFEKLYPTHNQQPLTYEL